MFAYSSVSASVQEKLRTSLMQFVKVVYNDPDPILEGHEPYPVTVPAGFKALDSAYKELQIRNDDIWILSYPKTGTTWTMELVTRLLSGLDAELIEMLFSFLPTHLIGSLDEVVAAPGRRTLSSHLPLNLLPRGLLHSSEHKMIYVIRNPKDTAVSWYHHCVGIMGFQGSLADNLDCFLSRDHVYGSYFEHVDEFLRLSKIKKNLLVITYEQLKERPVSTIQRVAEYLEITLNNGDAQDLADFIHFDKMKNRTNSNREGIVNVHKGNKSGGDFKFCRKGKIGSYKEEMPLEYVEKFNEEMKKWPALMALYPNL